MVRELTKNGETLYACEICKLFYKEKSWAERCQNFCKKYNACSLEITRYSVNLGKK